MQPIFHITQRQQWEAAQQLGVYREASLETEGFIHCSTLHQISKVANFFFAGQTGLVLLCIDGNRLHSELRYDLVEDNPVKNSELFPHVYGTVNLDAIVQVLDFEPQQDGKFVLPQELNQQMG